VYRESLFFAVFPFLGVSLSLQNRSGGLYRLGTMAVDVVSWRACDLVEKIFIPTNYLILFSVLLMMVLLS
jgi:hypothetical protein